MFSVLALVVGEALLVFGLWVAWPPLGFVAAGSQLVILALFRNEKPLTSRVKGGGRS